MTFFYGRRIRDKCVPVDKLIYVIEDIDTQKLCNKRNEDDIKEEEKQDEFVNLTKDETEMKSFVREIVSSRKENIKKGINLGHLLNVFDGLIEQTWKNDCYLD